jgi:hypothetical protein
VFSKRHRGHTRALATMAEAEVKVEVDIEKMFPLKESVFPPDISWFYSLGRATQTERQGETAVLKSNRALYEYQLARAMREMSETEEQRAKLNLAAKQLPAEVLAAAIFDASRKQIAELSDKVIQQNKNIVSIQGNLSDVKCYLNRMCSAPPVEQDLFFVLSVEVHEMILNHFDAECLFKMQLHTVCKKFHKLVQACSQTFFDKLAAVQHMRHALTFEEPTEPTETWGKYVSFEKNCWIERGYRITNTPEGILFEVVNTGFKVTAITYGKAISASFSVNSCAVLTLKHVLVFRADPARYTVYIIQGNPDLTPCIIANDDRSVDSSPTAELVVHLNKINALGKLSPEEVDDHFKETKRRKTTKKCVEEWRGVERCLALGVPLVSTKNETLPAGGEDRFAIVCSNKVDHHQVRILTTAIDEKEPTWKFSDIVDLEPAKKNKTKPKLTFSAFVSNGDGEFTLIAVRRFATGGTQSTYFASPCGGGKWSLRATENMGKKMLVRDVAFSKHRGLYVLTNNSVFFKRQATTKIPDRRPLTWVADTTDVNKLSVLKNGVVVAANGSGGAHKDLYVLG